MDETDINKLADLWIANWESGDHFERSLEEVDAIDEVSDLTFDADHETLWRFVKAAYHKEMSSRVFAILAAGPLEELLAEFGSGYIDRIETLARQDPKFNELFGGVWKNSTTDDIWERVTRVRNSVW